MYKPIRVTSRSTNSTHKGRNRFQHWRVDHQIYFITARCRGRFPAFAAEEAKRIFWNRFEHYTDKFGFTPWVTSLLDNHYHTLGYLSEGDNLGKMMQRIHGSVAKLVNDTLPVRLTEFWRDDKGHEYFDGCIRNEKQCRLAFRYTFTQCVRHRLGVNPLLYPHTRVVIPMEMGVSDALARGAFLPGVGYRRYERNRPAR